VRVEARVGVTMLDDMLLLPMRAVDLPVLSAPFTYHPAGAGAAGYRGTVPGQRIKPMAAWRRAAALRAS
jgi:hypothetical protein